MKREQLCEDSAFRKLQKTATSRRTKLVEIAREIVEQAELASAKN